MSDETVIPPELEQKLSELEIARQAIEEAQKKASDYYDQLLRLRAEFDNYRKRTEKEKVEARAWGKQQVLEPLLGLVDVFEQALAQAQQAKDMTVVIQGLEFLSKNFNQMLKQEGLEVIDVVGQPFNHETAEAVDQEEVDANQVGIVLLQHQKGYRFQGRVLRPARVKVGVERKTETTI